MRILFFSFFPLLSRQNRTLSDKEEISTAKSGALDSRPMECMEMFAELKDLWLNQRISTREAAKKLGVTHSTFLRWVKEENE